MRICLIIFLAFSSISCSGKGWIVRLEPDKDGELEIKEAYYYNGRNIKCQTEKGAGMETQNMQPPTFPFKF